MSLIKKLEQLERDYAILEPNEEERQQINQEVIGFSDEFLAGINDINAYQGDGTMESSFALDDKKHHFKEILSIYRKDVIGKGVVPASGGHIGYIPGGGIYAASIADYIAAFTNEYAGLYYGSPGAVTIENETIEWLKKLFAFPETAVGNLTSGGSIANLIAMTAARDKYKIKNEHIHNAVIYLSPQVHHCLHKAVRIIGLEDIQYRMVKLDKKSRMCPQDLADKVAEDKRKGLLPFLIVASAGTTDTGAVDPLNEIAQIAQENKLWFHVDAAYGGFFIMVDEKKSLFKGIEKADSLVVDPHKGLFLPYGLGAVLVKDKKAVMQSHHYLARYMQDSHGDGIDSPCDLSPELTKHFRGLRLWLPLKLYGKTPFQACLQHKLLLTRYFRKQLELIGFALGPEPDLSVSYFWFPCEKSIENDFNKKLLAYIHDDGRVFMSSTIIDEKFVIRMAILAFRTSINTVDKGMLMIKEALDKCIKDFNISY